MRTSSGRDSLSFRLSAASLQNTKPVPIRLCASITTTKKKSPLRFSFPVTVRYSRTSAITHPEAAPPSINPRIPLSGTLRLSRLGRKRMDQAKSHRPRANGSKIIRGLMTELNISLNQLRVLGLTTRNNTTRDPTWRLSSSEGPATYRLMPDEPYRILPQQQWEALGRRVAESKAARGSSMVAQDRPESE